MPEPTQLATQTADATHVAQGARADGKHDATETHVEAAMWETARPAMRALSDVVDGWERFGKRLLSPSGLAYSGSWSSRGRCTG
ncbi:uncharacterized protein LAESUDRAFT_730619 [Laetiporus sulphureus 93-53]|uniref:Uncharacterized protein n=1 Tax=Laetiporus sulphureus 93-53 TaxID=1314785 RepID=A0A165C2V1_9APHY|nr:uncharacterized protein LAESUDRAFT_730619 [Laetiporus sulphureus 93-53]KZT02101.1 hypothetical protein LAESUDRAFT_730619 [Laetiporus sulphureus 93-53]